MMLLIMVNDEEAQNEQPGKETADNFAHAMEIPKSATGRGD
jgi:hypothetical protein